MLWSLSSLCEALFLSCCQRPYLGLTVTQGWCCSTSSIPYISGKSLTCTLEICGIHGGSYEIYTHTHKKLLYGELLGRPHRCGGPTTCVCRADSVSRTVVEQETPSTACGEQFRQREGCGQKRQLSGTLIIKHSHFYMGRWQNLSLLPLCPQSELVWWDLGQSQSLACFLGCLILLPVLSSRSRTPCAKYIIACRVIVQADFKWQPCNDVAVKNPSTKASMPTPLMNRSLLPTSSADH